MAGAFPPSSRFTLVIFCAAALMTTEPVSTLPVKLIIPMRGEDASAFPAMVAATVHDIDYPRWQIGLQQQFAELHRIEWCFLTGLYDNRVSGYQCGCGFTGNEEEREIPRQDAANHADGQAEKKDGFPGAVTFQDFAFNPPRPFRHIVQVIGRESNLNAREFKNLALLLGNDSRKESPPGREFGSLCRVERVPAGWPAVSPILVCTDAAADTATSTSAGKLSGTVPRACPLEGLTTVIRSVPVEETNLPLTKFW